MNFATNWFLHLLKVFSNYSTNILMAARLQFYIDVLILIELFSVNNALITAPTTTWKVSFDFGPFILDPTLSTPKLHIVLTSKVALSNQV